MPSMRFDATGQITGFNRALRALCAVPDELVPGTLAEALARLDLRHLDGSVVSASDASLWPASQHAAPVPRTLRLGDPLHGTSRGVVLRCERVVDAQGHPRGGVAVLQLIDDTERPAGEESHDDLRSLMRHTPGFFFRALDRPGYPALFVSDAVETLTGRPAASFIDGGLTFFDVILEEDRNAFVDAVSRQARHGPHIRVDYRIRHVDGSVRWMHSAASRVRLADGTHVFEGLSLDITPQKNAEAAYAAAHARLMAMFQQSAQMQGQLSARGIILDLNDRALSGSGWPRAASVGLPFWDAPWWANLPEQRERVHQTILSAMTGAPSRVQCTYQVRAGPGLELRHCDLSAVPVLDADHELLNICVTGVDITHAEQARAALAEREAQLRLLMTNSPGVVFRCDAGDDCRVQFVSDGVTRLSGYPAADFTDGTRSWKSMILEDDQASVRDAIRRQQADGDSLDLRYRVRHRDGRVLWCDVHARRVQGHVYEGVVLDVSARVRAERALAESEGRYRSLFEVSPVMLWRARSDGRVEEFNKAGLEYLGVTSDALRSDGWQRYVHPDDLQTLLGAWRQSLQDGAPLNTEFRKRRHDGAYRWMQVRALPERDAEGRITSWIGANADIDEIKCAHEAAQAAGHAKSQFLANMSHEIRTPMNGVIGMASLLQETPLNDLQREYVHTIRTSGEHLLSLINDILDFSKAEAGRLELESYAFDLRTCVEEAMELVAPSAVNKLLDITLDSAPDLPERITGDAGRLRQILVNLLSNAIKFTERGEIEVRVEVATAAVDDQPWRLRFSVRDTGIGIPAERRDRLFGVFSQVDTSHSRLYGGSGLGLAICKRLVEQMGGSIVVRSAPGEGSTFTFDIQASAAPSEAKAPTWRFDGACALVVDDHPTNRRILRDTLETVGIAVTDVADAAAALACVRAAPFDVALLDYQMPALTGVELAQAIRSTPQGASLPMILLGSSTAALTPAPSLFAARLLKPLRRATLYDQLGTILRGDANSHADASAADEGPVPRPLRVLVAEDNSVNQRVALHFLHRLGYRADVVANGVEAVDALRRQPYDVVLMDVQMPQMDGLEATSLIRRELDPGPYIIAVTANVLPDDERRCREAGMQAFLTKPLSMSALEVALERAATAATPALASPGDDFNPAGLSQVIDTFETDGALELVTTLEDSVDAEVETLRRALSGQVARDAARVLHTWKGHCRLFESHALAEACQAAERAAQQAAFADLEPTHPGLVSRYRTLLRDLAGALAARQGR